MELPILRHQIKTFRQWLDAHHIAYKCGEGGYHILWVQIGDTRCPLCALKGYPNHYVGRGLLAEVLSVFLLEEGHRTWNNQKWG